MLCFQLQEKLFLYSRNIFTLQKSSSQEPQENKIQHQNRVFQGYICRNKLMYLSHQKETIKKED